jgi:hypothetical protein
LTATAAAFATTASTTAVAAATTAVAPATTAAAVAAAAAAITAAAAPATWRTSFTRPGFVDRQRPTFDSFSVQLRDCVLGILLGCHCDECESARLTGELVLHERDFLNPARLGEKVLKIRLGRVEGKISYV